MPLNYLDESLRELKKQAQKTKIRATGRSNVSKSKKNIKKIEKSGEKEFKLAKSNIIKASSGLQDTITGQFGDSVTKVLAEQKTMLDNF